MSPAAQTHEKTSEFVQRVRLDHEPAANPASVVVSGDARFTVLTPRLLRLEWSPDANFDERGSYAFPHRLNHNPPAFETRRDNGELIIETGHLELRYREESGRFNPENLRITLEVAGEKVTWRPGTPDEANLFGARRTLDGVRMEATIDPGILSRGGWTLFDDSATVRFSFEDGWIEPPLEAPEQMPKEPLADSLDEPDEGELAVKDHPHQDWYFFGYGHDYKAALREYLDFGGHIPLIPRYVLGLWWSRYWAYSAQDLKDLVLSFEYHDLPLDILVVDMDWHTEDDWTGYTWHPELFPDPKGFLDWLHARGLRTTLNLHPANGVQKFEQMYEEFCEAMGQDPSTGEPVPFRITDKEFARNYFELLHHPREKEGVDFWWMDWQQGTQSEMPGLDPLIWLNHLHFRDLARHGHRSMLFSRWGGLGNHRYPIGFSGDTIAEWEVLNQIPSFTVAASNVLYGWWSHDIGAHMGASPKGREGEYYIRWVQFGVLSPIVRVHATKDPRCERRPWAFGDDVLDAARRAFYLRYELVPYLYTAGREMSETGISPCRPMYYEHPEDEAAYTARWQYYLGDHMIAAPIVEPADPANGIAGVTVWIPDGQWIDYSTLEIFTGPRWVRITGDIHRLPLLARAGAVIPIAPKVKQIDHIPRDLLKLKVFPGPSGQTRHYEDDTISENYHEGDSEWTAIRMLTEDDRRCTLTIDPVEGKCRELPAERRYEIEFVGLNRPTVVTLDGQKFGNWEYIEDTQSVHVALPARAKTDQVIVAVEAEAPISALGPKHDAELISADVRRILGEAIEEDATAELVGYIRQSLQSQGPEARMAQARVGAPFFHTIEYTAACEARQQLGRLIAAAPLDATPFTVRGKWTHHLGGDKQEYPFEAVDCVEAQVFTTPFRYDQPIEPEWWTLEATIEWQGHTIHEEFTSRCIDPSVTQWHWAIIDRHDKKLDHPRAIDDKGKYNPRCDWQVVKREYATVDNITQWLWFPWPEEILDRLRANAEPTMYIASKIIADAHKPVKLRLLGPVDRSRPLQDTRYFFNGTQVAFDPDTLEADVELSKGLNRFVAHVHLVGFDLFAMAIFNPDGTPATGLKYE